MHEDPAACAGRFRRAAIVGSLVALLPALLLLAGPEHSLTSDPGLLGGFFDAQARAFLDGTLAVPADAVSFEGIVTDGKTYEYYGPVLALLRLPVLVLTHGLDQRLTQLSMLLALLGLLAATAVLHWRARTWLRPEAELSRRELVLVAALQVSVGAGSVAFHLLGRPLVYYETELWGAALAVATLAAVLGVLLAPSGRRVALAVLFATLTINTRVSVGLAAVLALVVAAVVLLSVRPAPRRLVTGLAVGVLVALGSSAALNVAKFGIPFGVPLDRQLFSQSDPARKAALAANDGTIFGVQFAPTQVLAAVRPDAVGTVRAFPWIGLPAAPPTVVGDVHFESLQPSLSATTSMTLLCLLTLVALVGACRRRGVHRWATLGLLGAAAAGYVGVLSIAYVTTRYLADALPLLVLGGALGLQELVRAGRAGRPLVAATVGLVVLGAAINGGTGLLEQRLTGSTLDEAQRAAWVRTQDRIDASLGRSPRGITQGGRLPGVAGRREGDLAIVGRCDGLYVLDTQGVFSAVERTARTGRLRLSVGGPPGASGVLAVAGRGTDRLTLLARREASGLRLALRTAGGDQPLGAPVPMNSGAVVTVELVFEPSLYGKQLAIARVAGQDAAGLALDRVPAGGFRLAGEITGGEGRRFSGAVEQVSLDAPLCRRLARRAGLRR